MSTKTPRDGQGKKKPQLGKILTLPHRGLAPPRPVPTAEGLDQERIHEALAQMASLLVEPLHLPEAQREQLAIVHGLVGARTSFLLEHSALKNQLQISAVRGRNDPKIRAYEEGEPPYLAFEEKRVVRAPGLLAVPLLGREQPLGALVLMGSKTAVADSVLRAAAANITAAWEVARLRDDSARRNKDLQTAVAGLKSLEKNREELLANVSHELKNPLTTIRAYLTMLSRGKLGEVNEKQLKALQSSDRNADRLLRLINELLLLSRLQSGKMQLDERPFGLKGVAEEVLEGLRPQAEQARVQVSLAPSPEAFVRGDRERIAEAAYNLLENAIQFSRPGTEVEAKISVEGSLVSLSIKDQGIGIDSGDLSGLFDPYNRPRHTEGARSFRGLGLPIVSKIVNLHGGRVDAVSKLGEGSTFTLTLPVFAGAVATPAEAQQAPRTGGILLVEDDADCREVVQQLLEDEGYRVIATSGATEARSVLAHIRPALVLLDLMLRDEDGRTVLSFIRETPALTDIPVYIISGASNLASLHGGTGNARVDGIIEKPVHVPKLLDLVSSVVRPVRKHPAAG